MSESNVRNREVGPLPARVVALETQVRDVSRALRLRSTPSPSQSPENPLAKWGGISGNLADQTDLADVLIGINNNAQQAADIGAQAYTLADGALSKTGGVVSGPTTFSGAVTMNGAATVGGSSVVTASNTITMGNKTLSAPKLNGWVQTAGQISTSTASPTQAEPLQYVTVSVTTITLPAAQGGRMFTIKHVLGTTPNITILPPSGGTIDGQSSVKITNAYGCIQFGASASNWFILSRY